MYFANTLTDALEVDDARRMIAPLVGHSRAMGSADLAGHLDLLAFAELHAGNLRRAVVLGARQSTWQVRPGGSKTELFSTCRLGWVEGWLGDVEHARLSVTGPSGSPSTGAGSCAAGAVGLGFLESSLENYESAFAYLDPANPLTGTVNPQRPTPVVPELVEVLVGLDRVDEARDRLQRYEERAVALNRTFAIARVAHCRGLILAAEGDLAGAETAATRAVAVNTEHRLAVHRGRSLSALGAVQRRRGRKADARATLRRAVAVLDEAGAAIWLDRARRELGRIGGRKSQTGSQLSTTETLIAELVACGRSNAEVAGALHMSRKTVEWNLSKIYRKLDVRSRTELAARKASTARLSNASSSRSASPPAW